MTDEERDTRHGLELASALRKHDVAIVNLRDSAADELERLVKECGEWKKNSDFWLDIATRLQNDLRNGTRTIDFSFLGASQGFTFTWYQP